MQALGAELVVHGDDFQEAREYSRRLAHEQDLLAVPSFDPLLVMGVSKLGISVIAVWHITDHYGQLVEYVRLNGIVPPMSQKYGLKVR